MAYITIYVLYTNLYRVGALQQGGWGDMSPTLKSRGTSYVLVSPHFYHNIYFDWLVPPAFKIVPAPLV